MRAHGLLLSLVLAAIFASGARASVMLHRFDLEVENRTGSIEIGSTFSGVLVLRVGEDQFIESLDLSSLGWRVDAFDPQLPGEVSAGQELRIPFTVTPVDENFPLTLRVDSEGEAEELVVAPAVRRVRRRIAMSPTTRGPDMRNESAGAPSALLVEEKRQRRSAESPLKIPAGTPRNIRIHGAIVYDRVDGMRLGAYGLKVEVHELDLLGSNYLDSSICDADGSFDFTVVFNETILDRNPDLEIRFVTNTTIAKVRPRGALSSSYSWTQGPWNDFTGTDLDLGTLIPLNNDDHPPLHILNSMTQAWVGLSDEGQGVVPQVTVVYPDDAWPHYDPTFERIHLPRDYDESPADPDNPLIDFQWRERVHIHEYGHHVLRKWGSVGSIDYCNFLCDIPDCGHCLYCSETEEIAWSEGWSDWFSEYTTLQFPARAGYTAYSTYDFEHSPRCGTAPEITWVPPVCECNAWDTEGFFASLLHDIADAVDSNRIDNPTWLSVLSQKGQDVLGMGGSAIWGASFGTGVTTPRQFIDLFVANHPGMEEPIWLTAALNSYDLDQQEPGIVGSLVSTSHPIGSPSSNAIVDFTWTPAPDDFSGIRGYYIDWGPAPTMPTIDGTPEMGDLTNWSSLATQPGDWYFSIMAVDNSGRTSPNYVSYGPITILTPDPADLSPTIPAGWSRSIVPRPTADAILTSVPMPTVLNPYPASTWVNLAVINSGETSAPPLDVWGFLDDYSLLSWNMWAGAPAGFVARRINGGPLVVPPGLHTLWMAIDPLNTVYESNELDNLMGYQWVWEPPLLGRDQAAPVLGQPGRATAGWDAVPVFFPFLITYYNADGFRMHSYDGFHAASLRANANSTDYDLRLYVPSTSSTIGFQQYNAWSTQPAGRLDVVITNSDGGGVRDYDLGVLNLVSGNSGPYQLTTHGAEAAAVGDSLALAIGADEFLFLRQFQVSEADTGAVTVSLETDPASGPWHLSLFDPSTVHTELSSAPFDTTTDASGACALSLNLSVMGRYAFVAHREPIGGTEATTVVYEIERTPPDLTPHAPATWYASIVPRETGGSFGTLPAPTYLPSDQPVFVYAASTNLGPNPAPSSTSGVELDGASVMTVPSSMLPAGAVSMSQLGTLSVGPGRHTLVAVLDRDDQVDELDEANNREGQQYIFDPLPLGRTPLEIAMTPPPRVAGLAEIPSGYPAYYNCSGFRPASVELLGSSTGWILAGLMPRRDGVAEDVDLRVHPGATSGVDGFDLSLAQSNWGPGQSDFVLVHPDSAAQGRVDLGVVAVQTMSGYTVCAVGDSLLVWKQIDTPRVFEGLRLPPSQVAEVFSLELPEGSYSAQLSTPGPRADLGLSVFSPDGAAWTFAKGEEPVGAGSWFAPAGESELALFDVDRYGLALIVVWKVTDRDLPEDQEFSLLLSRRSATDVPERPAGPRRVAITRTFPNPFNPRVEISYELPRTGDVRLSVYDLRGQRVATLVETMLAAGSHRVIWRGFDDQGRSVSSGVYFLRLEGPHGKDVAKVVLVR